MAPLAYWASVMVPRREGATRSRPGAVEWDAPRNHVEGHLDARVLGELLRGAGVRPDDADGNDAADQRGRTRAPG